MKIQNRKLNTYISKLRSDKNISAKSLSYGLCTQSVLTDFEGGKKDVDGLIFDNILQRLGTSEDGYVCYHSKDKIECIVQRNNIISLIDNNEFVKVEQEVEIYREKYWNKNNLHKQFILLIESRLVILKENNFELAYKKLRQAIAYTVPEIEKKKLFRLLIGFNELFLIVESLKVKSKICYDVSIYEAYEEILEYIKNREWEDLLKVKIYNKVICLISEYWLLEREYDKTLNHCNKAIKYIQSTSKLYFISEILKIKIMSLEGLINMETNSLKDNSFDLSKYEDDYKVAIEWKNIIDNLFIEYGAVKEPYEWHPYYNSKEINHVVEVIKKRQIMFQHSDEDLSYDICDIITLKRIKDGKQDPRPRTTRNLLRRLNIANEIYNTDIVSDDVELHNLFNEINDLLHIRKFKEANKLLDILDKRLDSSNAINKQYFMHKKTTSLKNLELIYKEEAMRAYEEALYITLPKNLNLKSPNNFFTKREILLMVNIAIVAEELGDKVKALEKYEVIETYFNNMGDDITNHIITYEIFSTSYQSFLGNILNFEKSNRINDKLLIEYLKLRRGSLIGDLLYSQAFNFKESIEQKREMQDFEKDLYIKELKKSYIMACIMKDEFSINFLNKEMIDL